VRGFSAWTPVGEPVVIAGRRITAGMFYLGHGLPAVRGAVEPAQINPRLPVDPVGTHPSTDPGPAPSYHLLSAAHRALYLDWLAGGRRRADVPIGLPVLFCSGLERRILVDHREDPCAVGAEPAQFAVEVARLADLFGGEYPSFARHTAAFREALELLAAPPVRPPGAPWPDAPVTTGAKAGHASSEVPQRLRILLAQCANAGRAVPADWVHAWARHHPLLVPSTPQLRCPEEFTRLFHLRLQAAWPQGVVPEASGAPPIRLGYRPANPGMDSVVVERPDLPDVLAAPQAIRVLAALTDEVTAALTPYSRWLGRTPEGRESLASTRLLPTDLLRAAPGPLRPLLDWATRHLAARNHVVVEAAELATHWSSADRSGRMSHEEATAFAEVLDRIGVGVEPDVRFGVSPLHPGPAVIFRLDPAAATPSAGTATPAQAVSPRFTVAAHLVAVAAVTVLSAADNPGTAQAGAVAVTAERRDDVVNRAVTDLAVYLDLSVRERDRLTARLHWLLVSPPDARTVQRAALRLDADARDRGGDFLVRLATDVGACGHREVAALAEGFRLLGLHLDELHRRLHTMLTESSSPTAVRPDAEPVVVRSRRAARSGHTLPWVVPTSPGRPAGYAENPARRPQEAAAPDAPTTRPTASSEFRLRTAVVAHRMAETAAVEALLAQIFCDGTDDVGGAPAAGPASRRPEHGTPCPDDARPGRHDSGAPGPDGDPPGSPPDGQDLEAAPLALLTTILADDATGGTWTTARFRAEAARHDLLPAAALDLLNDEAIRLTGEPVLDLDGDLLRVDAEIAAELLT